MEETFRERITPARFEFTSLRDLYCESLDNRWRRIAIVHDDSATLGEAFVTIVGVGQNLTMR